MKKFLLLMVCALIASNINAQLTGQRKNLRGKTVKIVFLS